MAKLNFTYDTYVIHFLPMLLFPIVPFLFMSLFMFSIFISYLANSTKPFLWSRDLVKKLVMLLPEAIFGPPCGLLSYESGKSIETDSMFILKRRFKRIGFKYLSFLGFTFILYAIIIFWDLFLLEESYMCDDSIDCFDFNDTDIAVTDCSLYEGREKYAVVCYKFVFSFGTALAAFGGLITSLKLIVKITTKIAVRIYSHFPKYSEHLYIIFVVGSIFVLIGGFLVYLFTRSGEHISFHVVLPNTIKFLLTLVATLSGFAVPWFYLTEKVEAQQELPSGDTEPLLAPTDDRGSANGGYGSIERRNSL